jgi:quercetin dioxygenase-like cupin family protein
MQALEQVTNSGRSLEEIEGAMLAYPQVDCQITHRFGPNIYIREGLIPAGTLIMGHTHRTEHMNVVLKGRVAVVMDGEVQILEGPTSFTAPAGRKVIYAIDEAIMQNVHVTSETDVAALEDQLVDKSDTWKVNEVAASTDALLSAIEGTS